MRLLANLESLFNLEFCLDWHPVAVVSTTVPVPRMDHWQLPAETIKVSELIHIPQLAKPIFKALLIENIFSWVIKTFLLYAVTCQHITVKKIKYYINVLF